MKSLEDLGRQPAAWLSGQGERGDIVLSSRVRLARNIANHFYPQRADEEQHRQVVDLISTALDKTGISKSGCFIESENIDEFSRDILIERHLISQEFLRDDRPRGLFINEDETSSLMVNEEDHLRMQAVSSGMNIRQAMATASDIDEQLGSVLEYDTDPRLGYLTACPTNVGTGMRASVLIHLPGLVLTKEMDAILSQVAKIGLTVRGFYGEGSDVVGNLFQISNQTTLGRSEDDLIESLEKVTRQLIAYEQDARGKMFADAPYQIKDKIWRALGILAMARVLTSDEVMNLLSAARLGVSTEIIKGIDLALLNELLLYTRRAHLQRLMGRRMTAEDRDIARAKLIRQRLWPAVRIIEEEIEDEDDTDIDKTDEDE
jgi:protein arginine kinase